MREGLAQQARLMVHFKLEKMLKSGCPSLVFHDHASESEIVLLENVIGYANSSNSSPKSTELIQYALDRVEGMDADKQNFFYDYACKDQVKRLGEFLNKD